MSLENTITQILIENPSHTQRVEERKNYFIITLNSKPDKDGVVWSNSVVIVNKNSGDVKYISGIEYYMTKDQYDY